MTIAQELRAAVAHAVKVGVSEAAITAAIGEARQASKQNGRRFTMGDELAAVRACKPGAVPAPTETAEQISKAYDAERNPRKKAELWAKWKQAAGIK